MLENYKSPFEGGFRGMFTANNIPYTLSAIWIAATTLYFYTRFTLTIYQTQKHQIDALLDRLLN